eukprot:TRINITY_DN22084_c0_g1_i1.p1 TRINITY_DN22084_c0_g1~~TRINITY_DN22084_c0_g1_i1.p1  ORF type:complete len:427 (+),score=106.05 TRINITY_DN22084_c0_g1_i1:73-1353(+)
MADVQAVGGSGSAAAGEDSAGGSGSSRSSAFKALIARRREAHKTQTEAKRALEEDGTETFSGLRIEERCLRKEKWESCMRGKDLVDFSQLGVLRKPGSSNYVLIGVLFARPVGARAAGISAAERQVEWRLTDLRKGQPLQEVTVQLAHDAVDYWGCSDGLGYKQIQVGSIFAVLNPAPANRPNAVRVTQGSQIVKLGSCPSLGLCSAKTSDGLDCRSPYNLDTAATYCARHEGMSTWTRCNEVSGGGRTKAVLSSQPLVSQRGVTVGQVSPAGAAAAAASSSSSGKYAGLTVNKLAAQCSTEADADVEATLSPEALQARQLLLKAATASKSQVLAALQSLEALEDRAGLVMARGAVYEAVGKLVGRGDSVSDIAGRLRRRWRLLRDSAAAARPGPPTDLPSQISAVPRPRPERQEPLMKRAKLGLR